MIVLDASVLIGYLNPDDAHHQSAISIMIDEADDVFATSPLTMAEVLVGPARSGEAESIMNRLARIPIGTVELGADAPARLARLRVSTGLRMPDCCVLFAAESSTAAIATFDSRLATVAAGRGLRVLPQLTGQ